MKKLFYLLFLIQLILNAQDVKLKILVYSKSVSDADTIFIAGSSAQIGDWNPHKVKLIKENDSTWGNSFVLPLAEAIEFKFTLGGWNKEALNDDGSKPANSKIKLLNDTTVVFNISKWADLKDVIKGQITGSVQYFRNMEYPGLKPRDIIVWLPPDYEKDTTKYCPVLYMHDGQNIIDPKTSFNGIDWQVDETVDSLIRKNYIKEIIIVGIYNTQDRVAEYSDTDFGNKYMDFIINHLKPLIDKTYRTLSDKNNTATMGSSMGGLIAFMLGWEHPEIFSLVASFSPAIKVDPFDYLKKVKEYSGPRKDVKFYFYNGGLNIESTIQPGLDETIQFLINSGYVKGKDFDICIDPTEDHNESAWAKNTYKALLFLLPKER